MIVVDDTRDGRVVDAVTDSYVRVVRGASSGPSCARNLGVSSSHADIIVLLDDDVVVGPDLISTIRNRLEQSDALIAIDVAIYSGQQATDGSWRWRRVERTVPGGFLSACLAFPREAFDRIGGFEESWPVPNREDTDFGLRRAGIK